MQSKLKVHCQFLVREKQIGINCLNRCIDVEPLIANRFCTLLGSADMVLNGQRLNRHPAIVAHQGHFAPKGGGSTTVAVPPVLS